MSDKETHVHTPQDCQSGEVAADDYIDSCSMRWQEIHGADRCG